LAITKDKDAAVAALEKRKQYNKESWFIRYLPHCMKNLILAHPTEDVREAAILADHC